MIARRSRRRGNDRGVVLLNALVLVTALAGAAAALLLRAETQRGTQLAVREASQLGAYLDAWEALAMTALDGGGDVPDLDAIATSVPLDRGTVTGSVVDLQGRFNVNWLADPADTWARETAERLAARRGVPSAAIDAIAEAVSPAGPDAGPLVRRAVPERPVGGPVLMLAQLRGVPGLSDRAFDALAPVLTALPGDTPLNLDTAAPDLLRAAVPGLAEGTLAGLLTARSQAPFASVEEVLQRMGAAAAELDETRFAVRGAWFQAEARATLGDAARSRVTVIRRAPLPDGASVAYRLTTAPGPDWPGRP
jgi:general secretion pathway protein K